MAARRTGFRNNARFGVVALLVVIGSLLPGSPVAAQAAECTVEWPTSALQLMAPAAPGGGWDTTAREMQRVWGEEALLSQSVEVFNVEGAGGTIGLSDLVNENAGNENMMMVMGLVMIGGIALNESPVTLESVTPIARLIAEYEVIVVPADSPYQTLDDLLADFQADPGAISWGGGSAGGTDHLLIALLAQAIGVDPALINYVPFSGGGEALAAVLGGQTSAGVSGLGEWAGQIESGELRALAVSGRADTADGATPVAENSLASIPTLQELGIDLELANWRGIVGPPELSPEVTACMIAAVDALVQSEGWRAALATNGWTDFYLGGEEYGTFLDEQIATINSTLSELDI